MSMTPPISRRRLFKLTAAAVMGLIALPKLLRFSGNSNGIRHILPTASYS